MSKLKKARFTVRSRETVLKRGMMDYCVTGGYRHFAAGDAVLTDERFHFDADLSTGDMISFELPLKEINAVEKIGVPFFTQSMLITADSGQYRLNAVFVGRWVRAISRAARATKEKG